LGGKYSPVKVDWKTNDAKHDMLVGSAIILGVGACVGGGFLLYRHLKNKSDSDTKEDVEITKLAGKMVYETHKTDEYLRKVEGELKLREKYARQQPSALPLSPDAPVVEATPIIKAIPMGDLMNDTTPLPNRYIDHAIRVGKIVTIFGATGTGKSTLAAQIAISAASGTPSGAFPDDPNKPLAPKNIVYIYDLEMSAEDWKERYSNAFCGLQVSRVGSEDFSKIDPSEKVNALLNHVMQVAGNANAEEMYTILIDNLTALDANMTADESTAFFDNLKNAKNTAKARGAWMTFVVVDHTVKDAEGKVLNAGYQAGSYGKSTAAEMIIAVGRSRFEGKNYVKFLKNRSSEEAIIPDDFVILEDKKTSPYSHSELAQITKEADVMLVAGKKVAESKDQAGTQNSADSGSSGKLTQNQVEYAYKALNEKTKTKKQLSEELNVSRPTLDKYLKEYSESVSGDIDGEAA